MSNHYSPFMKITLIKISYIVGVPVLTFVIFNLLDAPLVFSWSCIASLLMAGAAFYPPVWYTQSLALGGGIAIIFSGMHAFIALVIWVVFIFCVGNFLYGTLIPEMETFGNK